MVLKLRSPGVLSPSCCYVLELPGSWERCLNDWDDGSTLTSVWKDWGVGSDYMVVGPPWHLFKMTLLCQFAVNLKSFLLPDLIECNTQIFSMDYITCCQLVCSILLYTACVNKSASLKEHFFLRKLYVNFVKVYNNMIGNIISFYQIFVVCNLDLWLRNYGKSCEVPRNLFGLIYLYYHNIHHWWHSLSISVEDK